MSEFLDRFSNAKYLDVRHGPGLGSHVMETGEYLGASYLSARINTQYGDKVKVRGVEATYAVGILAKLVAVAVDIAGRGDGWSHHVNTVSTAMIATHIASIGARHGLEAAGGGSAPTASLPAHRTTAVGAIPPAQQPGKFLNLDEVGRIAAMHGA